MPGIRAQKDKHMKTTTDYWPSGDENRRAWLVAYKAQLALLGGSVGVAAPDVAQYNSLCDAATGAIDNVVAKKNAYESALANRDTLVGAVVTCFRPMVRRIKAHQLYTKTIGEALDIEPDSTAIDPNTVQPALTASVHAGYVRVRVRRNGVQSVNLYMRRAGQAQWNLQCRVERATCDDTVPLAVPGVPEVREYRAVGVLNDAEVGLPSNPKVVVYAGQMAA